MNYVSHEGKHGNAPMLDLRLAEETNGRLVGGAPKLGLGKVEWIEEFDRRVGLRSQCLKIGLGL